MIRGGINRYQKLIREAVKDNQESTTLYGIVYQQKYITKLSLLINQEIKNMIKGEAGNKQTALKLLCHNTGWQARNIVTTSVLVVDVLNQN